MGFINKSAPGPKFTDFIDESDSNPDILIVPLLAFDSQGYRLGYGRGYYDKFYSNNKQLEYYGYGYDAQHIISLPNEPHDLKLKHVITERKIYEF